MRTIGHQKAYWWENFLTCWLSCHPLTLPCSNIYLVQLHAVDWQRIRWAVSYRKTLSVQMLWWLWWWYVCFGGKNSMKLCYFMTKREKTNAFIREHQYLALGTGTDFKGTSSPMQWLCRTGNKFQLFGKKGLKLVLNSHCNHVRSLFTWRDPEVL